MKAQNPGAVKAEEIYSSTGVIKLDNNLRVAGSGTFEGNVSIGGNLQINGKGGNASQKPASTDDIQYVSAAGQDSNDGLSWGTARRTIQAAQAALGSGGHIYIGPGTFTLSSGIVFTRPTQIDCARGHQTVIQYSAATGTAMTLAYPGGDGTGILGCTFRGPGSTTPTTAVALGKRPQGVITANIQDVTIGIHNAPSAGFGTGIAVGPGNVANVIDTRIANTVVQGCGVGIDDVDAENVMIFGGAVAENATGLKTGLYASDVSVYGTSFDTNTTYAIDVEGATTVNLMGAHFEDNILTGYKDFICQGGPHISNVTMHGGIFLEDGTSGRRTEFVKVASQYGSFNAFGVTLRTRGLTVDEAVNFGANGAGGDLQFYAMSKAGNIARSYAITAASPQYSKVIDFLLAVQGNDMTAALNHESLRLSGAGSFFVSAGRYYLGGSTSSPSIYNGAGRASGPCVTGSLYINTSGTRGDTLYVSEGGTWVAK